MSDFGHRYPPTVLERVLIAPVKALTRILAWVTRRLG